MFQSNTKKFLGWIIWFLRETFNASLPDSALVGWAEKAPVVQLFICSSQKSGCCLVSMDNHGWKSRKSSVSWAPAAILPWFKANAFYSAGVLLLVFLVSLQLLWKFSTMVAEGVEEREQLQLPWEEQSPEGALKCHILPCCSSPLLSDWGHSPANNSFLTLQTRFKF